MRLSSLSPFFYILMKKLVAISIIFFAFQFYKASSQVGWFSVDCGIKAPRVDPYGTIWVMDKDFTNAGISKRLPERQPLEEMSTLRYFPNPTDRNCYTLHTLPLTPRYLVRAGFYYGNYDGLDRPPTFNLSVVGLNWSTVDATLSTGGLVYKEASAAIPGGSLSLDVCLTQVRDGAVPFISSLEAVPMVALGVNFYRQMEAGVSFLLINRTSFGGDDDVRYTGLFSAEKYNRIWSRGTTPADCLEVRTVVDTVTPENDPPVTVLRSSIASPNTSYPIILTVDLPFHPTPHTTYFVFYFTEVAARPTPNDTRIIDIYINGAVRYTVQVEMNRCKVVTLYPETVAGPTVNITLASSESSTLPPIISAMEVFTRIDPDHQSHGEAPPSASCKARSYISCILLIHALIHLLYILHI